MLPLTADASHGVSVELVLVSFCALLPIVQLLPHLKSLSYDRLFNTMQLSKAGAESGMSPLFLTVVGDFPLSIKSIQPPVQTINTASAALPEKQR
jgi:hypothetical protein